MARIVALLLVFVALGCEASPRGESEPEIVSTVSIRLSDSGLQDGFPILDDLAMVFLYGMTDDYFVGEATVVDALVEDDRLSLSPTRTWANLGDGYLAQLRIPVLELKTGEAWNVPGGRAALPEGTRLRALGDHRACPTLERLDGRGRVLDGEFVATDRVFGTCRYVDAFANIGPTEVLVTGRFVTSAFRAVAGARGVLAFYVLSEDGGSGFEARSLLFMERLADGAYDASMFRNEPEREAITEEEYRAELAAYEERL